jgi:membrane associated rhomboid family serine protease
VFGTMQGVAHFAHLGGMLGAYLVLKLQAHRLRPG